MIIQKYSEKDKIEEKQKQEIIELLYEHLEQFGDPEADIADAIDYSLRHQNKPGGIIVTATDQGSQKLVRAMVVNKTGMGRYIPENILVYIATDKKVRGQGIGKLLIQNAINSSEGDK